MEAGWQRTGLSTGKGMEGITGSRGNRTGQERGVWGAVRQQRPAQRGGRGLSHMGGNHKPLTCRKKLRPAQRHCRIPRPSFLLKMLARSQKVAAQAEPLFANAK